VIPPAELGELEAFGSLLAGQAQAETGGALRTGFEGTPIYVRQNYLSSKDADTSGTRA
jgi:hypothetical protein